MAEGLLGRASKSEHELHGGTVAGCLSSCPVHGDHQASHRNQIQL